MNLFLLAFIYEVGHAGVQGCQVCMMKAPRWCTERSSNPTIKYIYIFFYIYIRIKQLKHRMISRNQFVGGGGGGGVSLGIYSSLKLTIQRRLRPSAKLDRS